MIGHLSGLIEELQRLAAAEGDLPVEALGPEDDIGSCWVYRVASVQATDDVGAAGQVTRYAALQLRF